jgi:hypothetical protein
MDALLLTILHKDTDMAIHQQEDPTGIHPPAIHTIKAAIMVCIIVHYLASYSADRSIMNAY